jgi:2-polyprenyl-6-methoxyphenol hydroxylase-like FAD-dependent oxidoreductase
MIEVPVLIAGGGPVGMTLSLELAHHGVHSLLVERNPSTTTHPKMDLTNGRSMELYRRLGMADKLRAVGVPIENCFDISWVTKLADHELYRFKYLSAAEETKRRREQNDGTLTLEAPMRVSQIVIEPVLKKAAEESPLVDVRFGWRFESCEQDAQGVTSTLRNSATGEVQLVRSRYLAGCDGGGSKVRAQMGIDNEGTPNVANMYMIHFRSTARDVLQRFGIAWHYQTGDGVLVAQNDVDMWTLHTFWPPEVDRSKLDPRKLVEDWVGCKFDFEVIVANPWSAHYLVAEKYRKGRVFLAGDASHQYMPTGGYGMNSGVADAVNLGWKLAAAVNGWGGEALLESYEAERRPVAKLSWATSEQHLKVRFAYAELYQSMGDMSGESVEAVVRREEAGRRVAELGNAENEAWGTEHGYRYDSAVVTREESAPPAFDPLVYTPSTYPGSRLPHLFLQDGRAVYDVLGKEMTLLVLGDVLVEPLEEAAHEVGVPLRVVRIDDAKAARLYERKLVLVRPDQHVAWRGDSLPTDLKALVETVAGKAKCASAVAVS